MLMPRIISLTALSLLLGKGLVHDASAHHALIAYDRNSVIEMTGVVEELFWVNPHIRIVVRDDNGEVWEMEGPPVNRMERNDGVQRESFAAGTRLTLIGMPHQRIENNLFPLVAVIDGERIVMERPDSERLGILEEEDTRVVVRDERYEEAVRNANGIFRVWNNVGRTFLIPPGSDYPLTEEGRARKAEWVQDEDDLAVQCVPAGMPEAMITPFPMEIIDNGDGTLTVLIEEWDNVRTIYMEGQPEPDELQHPHLGYSVGRWEDDVLVVSTTDVGYPYLDDLGTPMSDAAEIIGRFEMSEDETRLDWTGIVVDPANFAEPVRLPVMHFEWHPEVFIRPFDCTLYTPPGERVEGGPTR